MPVRLLWVDDAIQDPDATVLWLTEHGYHTETARTGSDGIAKWTMSTFDALILDLQLPDMPGLSLLRLAMRGHTTRPILVLTGFADIVDESSAMALGATLFREKPLFGEDLIAAIEETLRLGVRTTSQRGDHFIARGIAERYVLGPDDGTRRALLQDLIKALNSADAHLCTRYMEALRMLVSACASESILTLDRRLQHILRPDAGTTLPPHTLASTALHRLDEHVASGRRIDETTLATGMNVSRSSLSRCLVDGTGQGFREWRRVLCTRAAIQRLSTTSDNISQIAYLVGYEHPTQFTREFKDVVAVGPREFRDRL